MAADNMNRRHDRDTAGRLQNNKTRTRIRETGDAIFRSATHARATSARSGKAERARPTSRREELAEETATEKNEAFSRLAACSFPAFSPHKDEWQRELDAIRLSHDDAEARLERLEGRVKAYRLQCDLSRLGGFASALHAEEEIAQRKSLALALKLFEMQLGKLARLAFDWRRA